MLTHLNLTDNDTQPWSFAILIITDFSRFDQLDPTLNLYKGKYYLLCANIEIMQCKYSYVSMDYTPFQTTFAQRQWDKRYTHIHVYENSIITVFNIGSSLES